MRFRLFFLILGGGGKKASMPMGRREVWITFLLHGVMDIRFSKCSGFGMKDGRKRHICGIHAAICLSPTSCWRIAMRGTEH